MNWQVLVSSDLPVTPEYDLLRLQYRKFNESASMAMTGAKQLGPRLFMVFREPERLVEGTSVVNYDEDSHTFTVSTAADPSVIGYGSEGFAALKQRVLHEYDRVNGYASANSLEPIDPLIRASLETVGGA